MYIYFFGGSQPSVVSSQGSKGKDDLFDEGLEKNYVFHYPFYSSNGRQFNFREGFFRSARDALGFDR